MSNKTKTIAAKEDAKLALVPKRRFPEFVNAAGWERTTIADIGTFYYGKSAPKWSLEADAPTRCVRYGELYSKFGAIITETYSRTTIDPQTLRFSKGGEILVPRVGEKPEDFGKCCCYLPLANIAIGEMISVFETEQNPLFYTYYFRHLYRQFAKVVEGQHVKNLYYAKLTPLPIHRPSLPEQGKIAECLTSLDELIAAHSQKLDALKVHKNGLMQQLFPGEDEIVPRLRFAGAKVWTKRKVSEVLSKVSMPITVEPNKMYREIGVRSHGKGIFHKEPISGTTIGDKRVFRIVENALVLNIVFAWEQAVATTSKAETGMIASHRFPMYVPKSENCDVRFVKNVFLTPQGKHLLGVASPGGAGRNRTLGQEEFENLSIVLPDKEEQTKIADTISTVDDLIKSQTAEVETLRLHKKGLMQQLFPAPAEVDA